MPKCTVQGREGKVALRKCSNEGKFCQRVYLSEIIKRL